MAEKTMIRQLLSKWGLLSIQMQQAYVADMAVINKDGSADYVENAEEEPVIIDMEPIEEPAEKTENSDDVAQALFG